MKLVQSFYAQEQPLNHALLGAIITDAENKMS